MYLSNLFSEYNEISIPDFQRAYSWGESQVAQFVFDIAESSHTEHQYYYYGHYLLLREGSLGLVVDGQQRLTTLALFMAAAKYTLNITTPLQSLVLAKFHTVAYDDELFQGILRGENFQNKDFITQSGSRLIDAYKQLKHYCQNNKDHIATYMSILANAEITLHELDTLLRATQIFAYANDRGKPLTELEKVKAFIAYQYYRLDASEETIIHFYERFAHIYNSIELMGKLNEDQVLQSCLDAYYTFFDKNQSFTDAFQNENGSDEQGDVIKNKALVWLDTFVNRLELAFNGLVELEKFSKREVGKASAYQAILILHKTQPFYAFFIRINKLDHFNAQCVTDNYERMFTVFERLFLADHAKSSRASLVTHLKNKGFFRNFEEISSMENFMKSHIDWIEENWLYGEGSPWNISLLSNNLCHSGQIYHQISDSLVNYVLWQYERSLYKRTSCVDYFMISEPSIEHIGPQSIGSKGHIPGLGYSFSQKADYESDKFLNRMHGWGNLLLIPRSLNSELSDNSWYEKKDKIHKATTGKKAIHYSLKQYDEIKVYEKWSASAIEERGKKIVAFIKSKWFD